MAEVELALTNGLVAGDEWVGGGSVFWFVGRAKSVWFVGRAKNERGDRGRVVWEKESVKCNFSLGLKSSDSLPLFLSSLLFIISAFLCFCFSIFFCTFDMLVLLYIWQFFEYTSFLPIKKKKKSVKCFTFDLSVGHFTFESLSLTVWPENILQLSIFFTQTNMVKCVKKYFILRQTEHKLQTSITWSGLQM